MTIKDSWQTAGMRTTSGASELAEFIPTIDAWPVAKIRSAGAVIFGKTNLPTYAGDFPTYNDSFGTTSNPFDLSRSPRRFIWRRAAALLADSRHWRSEAILVARSESRPTCRRHGPQVELRAGANARSYPRSTGFFNAIGPAGGWANGSRCRGSVPRSRIALWSGPLELLGMDVEPTPSLPKTLHNYRIAAWLDDSYCPVDSEVAGVLADAAKTLAEAGARVDLDARPHLSLSEVSRLSLPSALSFQTAINRTLWSAGRDTRVTPIANTRHLTAMRHRDWLVANNAVADAFALEEFFADWDVILPPLFRAIRSDSARPLHADGISNGPVRRP